MEDILALFAKLINNPNIKIYKEIQKYYEKISKQEIAKSIENLIYERYYNHPDSGHRGK